MIRILPAQSVNELAEVRELMLEYSAMPGVVACLRDFEKEVASLPGAYAPPAGALLLAVEQTPGVAAGYAGCVGLRRLDAATCEMKRLFVRPAYRGKGAGQLLAEELIRTARAIGYERMVLDTLPSMQDAHKLYRTLNFRETSAYMKNPVPGALFFELSLNSRGC